MWELRSTAFRASHILARPSTPLGRWPQIRRHQSSTNFPRYGLRYKHQYKYVLTAPTLYAIIYPHRHTRAHSERTDDENRLPTSEPSLRSAVWRFTTNIVRRIACDRNILPHPGSCGLGAQAVWPTTGRAQDRTSQLVPTGHSDEENHHDDPDG